MNWFQIGGLIWTACAAGWLVLGVVTDLPECYVVGLGCIAVSYAFNRIGGES